MKKILFFCLGLLISFSANAKTTEVVWSIADASYVINSDDASLLSASYALGANLTNAGTMAASNADEGYEAVTYDPVFTTYRPSSRIYSRNAGHVVAFQVTPAAGHKFKPTKLSFDAARVGTNNGIVIVCTKLSGGTENTVATVTPLRNKIGEGNSTGYSHYEYYVNDYNSETPFLVLLYILDVAADKALALRNVVIKGEVDGEIYDAAHYISSLSCQGNLGSGVSDLDLLPTVSALKFGESARYGKTVYGDPSDFAAALQSSLSGHSVSTDYDEASHTLTVNVKEGEELVFTFNVNFTVTNRQPKGRPTALKRGLMAANLTAGGGAGNLVSWRSRKTDNRNYKFKLYRGTNAKTITTKLNAGNFITGKTNFTDAAGTKSSYYRLEVYDENDEIVENDTCKAWNSQVMYIDLEGGAPTDIWGRGATYTPNDASICDMDGDGEYEFILKWSPSNEKDAASTGTTSPEYYACYKMDGRRLWILTGGPNMFSSAHTSPFVAWDLDGDGFGEFMIKTGHGAIDGEGNYLSVDKNPTGNYLNSRGKQVDGEEWITVFDGITGAELKTINYHTNYADGSSYWGDNNQNRSERYLGGIAWLDGDGKNPSAVFARGYYSGAFIGAYDWDGGQLTLRWLHRAFNNTSGEVRYANGPTKTLTTTVAGEGCHWFSSADVNFDGKQEIIYGSGALKSDGTTLYRTGLGHGDALHVSDFDPTRPGMEVFMVHEKSPYGMDYRDGTTGELILHKTAGGDTGRGFMANFDPEREGPLWQASAWGNIFDKDGNSVVESKTWGGGASAQDRIYWTGTLGDDFWGKGVLETWNPQYNNFSRLTGCVDGSNYTYGNLNNSTKNNACLLGDIFGDWREEMVGWVEGGTKGFQLVVNATNYATDYIVPHLMDDFNYRAQLIEQNCCYNQPPHLGYNLRESKKIKVQTIEADEESDYGKYWGAVYVSYPVIIPEDVTAFSVTAYDHAIGGGDTLKVKRIDAGSIVAANSPMIFVSKVKDPVFVPTARAVTSTPSSTHINGSYSDYFKEITGSAAAYKHVYQFRNGNRGIGFYQTDGTWVTPGGEVYGVFGYNSRQPGADSYVMGSLYNSLTGISSLKAAEEASGQKDGKYLIGDRIIIVKNGTSYDTTGRVIDN